MNIGRLSQGAHYFPVARDLASQLPFFQSCNLATPTEAFISFGLDPDLHSAKQASQPERFD
jgi:hypothetical protein